jgi:flagellar motor switch protein FliM
MSEVLTQNEIDQLLQAIRGGGNDEYDDFDDIPQRPIRDKNKTKIKIYDFARPDVLSRDHTYGVSIAAERAARLSVDLLRSTLLSSKSVDECTFEEFARSVPTPCLIVLFEMTKDGQSSKALVEVDSIVCKSITSVVLGAKVRSPKVFSGMSSKLERSLTSVWIEGVIKILIEAMGADSFRVIDRYDSPVPLLSIFDRDSMMCLVSMEARVASQEGMVNFVFDSKSVKKIFRRKPPERTSPRKLDMAVEVVARLKPIDYTLDNIRQVKSGTIISTLGTGVDVFVNSSRLFEGEMIRSGYVKQTVSITRSVGDYYMKDMSVVTDLGHMKVQVAVELGRTTMTLDEVQQLRDGSILELNRLSGEPVDVFAGNALIAHGEVVLVGDVLGVRICEMESVLPE